MFFEYLQYSNKRLIISADKVTIFFSMANVLCKVFNVPQFRNPTNSLRSLRSKPPRMRFLLFKQAFCHILTDMSA